MPLESGNNILNQLKMLEKSEIIEQQTLNVEINMRYYHIQTYIHSKKLYYPLNSTFYVNH
jgi:hypothetical protein